MTPKQSGFAVDRRKFLTGVAVAGAATAATPAANATPAATAPARLPSALPPTAHQIAAETGTPKAGAQAQWPRA